MQLKRFVFTRESLQWSALCSCSTTSDAQPSWWLLQSAAERQRGRGWQSNQLLKTNHGVMYCRVGHNNLGHAAAHNLRRLLPRSKVITVSASTFLKDQTIEVLITLST